MNPELLQLSSQFLLQVKTGKDTRDIEGMLQKFSLKELHAGLINDEARKVFWINLYNAYYQIFAIHKHLVRNEIFKHSGVCFADFKLTLDNIEHGILRKYRSKYSFGYLPQLLPSSVVTTLCVEEIDFRIHFALNCGAKSCPPIACYNYDSLFRQLEQATHSFLATETQFDDKNKVAYLNKIMCWFHGDFSGREGIRTIIRIYLGRDISDYRIRYSDYDWSEHLNNFQESPL